MENIELKNKIKFKIIMSELYNEKKNKKKNRFCKMRNLAVAACFIVIFLGVGFSDAISEKIYDIYNFRKQYKIQTKLPEEVIEDDEKLNEIKNNNTNLIIPWDEETAPSINSENSPVEITEIGMDDYYMIFKGNLNVQEEVTNIMPLEDIYRIRIIDLVIKDEQGNILFCMEENKLKELFGTDNIEDIENNPQYCISEVILCMRKNGTETNANPLEFEYYINTKLPSIYPKSKKLIFEFSKIALDSKEACIGIEEKQYLNQDQSLTMLGNWQIEVDVPEKYYTRENVIAYEVVESDSNPINKLIYCYYKNGLMHAQFKLESEERNSGPWFSVKISDMLNEAGVENMLKDYIIYKYTSSDEVKELEAWNDEIYDIEEFYIENSNGVKSKEQGLLKREGDKLVQCSKTAYSSIGVINGILESCEIPGFENGIWSSPDGVIFDIDENLLTDEMTIHIKYLGKDINFKVRKMEVENENN